MRSGTNCATKAKAIYRELRSPERRRRPRLLELHVGLPDGLGAQLGCLVQAGGDPAVSRTPLSAATRLHSNGPQTRQCSREVAYCIHVLPQRRGPRRPRRARMTTLADQALGHIDQWFVSKTSAPTARAPTSRRQPGSTTFSRSWSGSPCRRSSAIGTSPRPARAAGGQEGARLALGARVGRDRPGVLVRELGRPIGRPGLPAKTGAPDLNLLIAPAYRLDVSPTGDTTYRDRGDQIFAGGVTGAYLEEAGSSSTRATCGASTT